jgi:hypothetical protein
MLPSAIVFQLCALGNDATQKEKFLSPTYKSTTFKQFLEHVKHDPWAAARWARCGDKEPIAVGSFWMFVAAAAGDNVRGSRLVT